MIDTVLTIPPRISTTATAARLTVLAQALTQTDLLTAVDETPDLTVFAPNNAAFQKLGPALSRLSVEQLAGILQYHGTVAFRSSRRGVLTGSSRERNRGLQPDPRRRRRDRDVERPIGPNHRVGR